MDDKVKSALEVLGFVESVKVGKIPKMKYVTKKYHKLAMIHHPDRPGADDETFKKISVAYRLLGEFLEDCKDEATEDDFEEEVARKLSSNFSSLMLK